MSKSKSIIGPPYGKHTLTRHLVYIFLTSVFLWFFFSAVNSYQVLNWGSLAGWLLRRGRLHSTAPRSIQWPCWCSFSFTCCQVNGKPSHHWRVDTPSQCLPLESHHRGKSPPATWSWTECPDQWWPHTTAPGCFPCQLLTKRLCSHDRAPPLSATLEAGASQQQRGDGQWGGPT